MQSNSQKTHVLAIDVGGTFVDFTICELATGARFVGKLLTEGSRESTFMKAVNTAVIMAGTSVGNLSRIVHGTTLTTNVIIEKSNHDVVLVTTQGFEDVMEIGRHDSPRKGSIHAWVKPERPISRQRIVGLEERVAHDGSVPTPITNSALEDVLHSIGDLAPSSIAISLVNAHVNPAHELRLAEALKERHPDIQVSLSHLVLAQAGEYERSTATLLNAYVQPAMTKYVGALVLSLVDGGVTAPLYLMGSDGGIMSAEDATRYPLRTVLSGPAAGAIAAMSLSRRYSQRGLFTLDCGGTSTDVACIENGEVDRTVEAEIGEFPLAARVIDITAIGAGGGSIARASGDRFNVGPESAGANPGPVCYGGGGVEPTVTDALLAMGRLPHSLADGSLTLDTAGAQSAIASSVGDPLGLTMEAAAESIVRLANVNMANALRKVSTQRGRDPRDFDLVVFGGAGGAHAMDVADLAGVTRVLVPQHPGVYTTEGLLQADIVRTYVRSFAHAPRLAEIGLGTLATVFFELEGEGHGHVASDPEIDGVVFERTIDLRYKNQGYEISVDLSSDEVSAASLDDARARFDKLHHSRYGYSFPNTEVEVTAARLSVSGELPHEPDPGQAELNETATGFETSATRRDVYFAESGWVETGIFQRGDLTVGMGIAGPAVVEQPDSTLVVPPSWKGVVLGDGQLLFLRDRDNATDGSLVEEKGANNG